MPIAPLATDNRLMSQVAIRCHPCVPASTAELYDWLEEQVGRLRADAPEGTIRLSSLTQAMPTGERDIGWLVELDLPEGESFLCGARGAALLRDLRLLGLQPTVLTALDALEVAVPSHRDLPVPAAGDTRSNSRPTSTPGAMLPWTDEWEKMIAALDTTRQPAAKLAASRRTGAPRGGSTRGSSPRRSPTGETGAAASESPRLSRAPATSRLRPTRREGGRSQ